MLTLAISSGKMTPADIIAYKLNPCQINTFSPRCVLIDSAATCRPQGGRRAELKRDHKCALIFDKRS